MKSLWKMGFVSLKQFEKMLQKQKLPPFADKHEARLMKILNKLKTLASDGDRMIVDWRMLEARKRKVMKLIKDTNNMEPSEKLRYRVSSELVFILNELNTMADQKFRVINKVKKIGCELKTISDEINTDLRRMKEQNESSTSTTMATTTTTAIIENEFKLDFGKKKRKKIKKYRRTRPEDDNRNDRSDLRIASSSL